VVPYYSPYYAFRPRFSIGFGLFVGFPVTYPYSYGLPAYVYPSYPTYPYGSVGVYGSTNPAPQDFGGVSFEITPDDAQIVVDGQYVGTVRDFSPSYQPLTLTPGPHHIELQAEGCLPMAFDVQVQPGQVIPYRGALQPQ